MYGSIDSLDSVEAMKPKKKSKKQFNLFHKLGQKSSKSDQFSVSYEHVPENEDACEKTRLLESLPVFGKKRYSSIFGDEADKSGKKAKKNVKFLTVDPADNGDKRIKKKKSLLKRTGKMIVRTCRLMTYGTPYMTHMSADFPYNSRYPPDYRYYDFETNQYDFGYSNNYMGTGGLGPSAFF